MQVNVVKMLFWEENFAMAFKATIPNDVVRVVAGETLYLGVGLAEVSHVIMADADFDPSGIDDEVLEKLYCAGKWYDKGMGACPGVVSFRRSIGDGRRPYLVVGVRDRTLRHPSGVEMGSGLLQCLEGADDDVRVGKGGLSSLPAIVPRYGLEVSRFPTWFRDKITSYLTELREDMVASALVDSSIPIVRSLEGVSFMVFLLSMTVGDDPQPWFLLSLTKLGFAASRDITPFLGDYERMAERSGLNNYATSYLDLCRLFGPEPGCAAPMELVDVLSDAPEDCVTRLTSSDEPIVQEDEVKFAAILVPTG